MRLTKAQIKDLTYQINGAAIEVHKSLGPGLLESVYHKCLVHELNIREISFISELLVPVNYKGLQLETELRCDLFIENTIVVELKAVEKILPIHEAQLLTYMNLLEAPFGILFNFNTTNIYHDGQKTYVNELYRILNE
ncbi:MAG TPA: GxxExxY protein [Bacteroidia bacterium]|nr:GxxExxY protein [Bacteroidia bacterium]